MEQIEQKTSLSPSAGAAPPRHPPPPRPPPPRLTPAAAPRDSPCQPNPAPHTASIPVPADQVPPRPPRVPTPVPGPNIPAPPPPPPLVAPPCPGHVCPQGGLRKPTSLDTNIGEAQSGSLAWLLQEAVERRKNHRKIEADDEMVTFHNDFQENVMLRSSLANEFARLTSSSDDSNDSVVERIVAPSHSQISGLFIFNIFK